MKIAVNLDNLTLVNTDNPAVEVREINLRRDDVLLVEVSIFKGGKQYELADGSTGNIQINEQGTFGGAGLGSDSTFTKVGTGADSVYTFELDLSGAAVDSAFSDASEAASIPATLEIKIEEGGFTMRTVPLTVTLQNALNQS